MFSIFRLPTPRLTHIYVTQQGGGKVLTVKSASAGIGKGLVGDRYLPVSGEDANLQGYANYWQRNGDTAHLHKLETNSTQEQAIIERAEQIGNASPPLCATSVSGALGGVCGVESSIWPSTLGKNVDNAHCK